MFIPSNNELENLKNSHEAGQGVHYRVAETLNEITEPLFPSVMASKEEFEDLKDRNPIAKWLHDRARQTLAEATKTATATTAAATTATPTPISITLTEGADVVDPNSEPTLNSIVGKLLNPRSSGFYMGPRSYKPGNGIVCFTSEWVVRIIGLQHFKLELKNSRFIVKDNSKLKIHGYVGT